LNTLQSNYGFTYFIPAVKNVYDLNKCYNNGIIMNDISKFQSNSAPVYHTNETCQMNATILHSKNKMIEQKTINDIVKNGRIKQGLSFKIINGFYSGNPKFFLNSNINFTDIATTFNNLQNSTNNNSINYESYSVEWYGFLKPDTSGIWNFKIDSDSVSLLWVGDIAINDYENINATINTKNSISNTVQMIANKFYPIRIQYGNATLGINNNFTLSIVGPNNNSGIPLLYSLYNSDGTLFEKTIMYYSLNEIAPDLTSQGLFNCYVSDINDKNNTLKIKQSPVDVTNCNGTFYDDYSNSIHYNQSNSSNKYLYRVDGDPKMNQLFMNRSVYNENSLLPVSITDTSLNNSYFGPITNYPSNSDMQNATQLSSTECLTKCNEDPNCKYFYSYTKTDGKNYCIRKTDSYFPNQIIPNQPNSNIKSSFNKIRTITPNFSSNDIRNKLQTKYTDDYKSFSNFELIIDKNFIVPDKYDIGYNGLHTRDQKQFIKNWNYQKGYGQPISEGFDNHGYQNSDITAKKSANPGDSNNLPERIIEKQINPITQSYQDYSNLQKDINNTYYDISSGIYKLTNYKKTGIRDILSSDEENKYDFSGNYFKYDTKKPRKEDAVKDDVNVMILEQNNMMMLGTLTIATLLIGAVYFGRE